MQQKEKQAGERGRCAEQDDDPGRHRSRGEGGRKMGEKEVRSGRPSSEGGDEGQDSEGLRLRVHQLEKDKLEVTSSHNQEVRDQENSPTLWPDVMDSLWG